MDKLNGKGVEGTKKGQTGVNWLHPMSHSGDAVTTGDAEDSWIRKYC